MTTIDTIDCDAIEPGVRELCRVLNASGLVRTLWSCEGHRPSIFGQTKPNAPFVILRASMDAVQCLQTALFRAKMEGKLHFDWIIQGNFLADYGNLEPKGDQWSASPTAMRAGHWQWWLKPSLPKGLGFLSFVLERRLRADLGTMPGILRESLEQPTLLQEADKGIEYPKFVGHKKSQKEGDYTGEAQQPIPESASRQSPDGICAPAVGARGFDIGSNPAAAYTAEHQRRVHGYRPESVEAGRTIAASPLKRKAAGVVAILVAGLFLSACGTSSDVELQKDGSGTDEPRPSPCVGAAGSPCSPIPYTAPGFVWGRG